jgi:hypothetical protein
MVFSLFHLKKWNSSLVATWQKKNIETFIWFWVVKWIHSFELNAFVGTIDSHINYMIINSILFIKICKNKSGFVNLSKDFDDNKALKEQLVLLIYV